jgi:2-polyprenyl-3-methyl-5-hydroxy-6-metoxy-1,4-benzoquinol methylase
MNVANFVSNLRYSFHELNKQRKFARDIKKGVMRQEPRFRPITKIYENVYEGYPVGTVEYAHVARYDFAKSIVSGLVLNAAAGSGYGNEILGRSGAKVIGVDLYEHPLQLAKTYFPAHEFVRGNILDLSMFADETFDAIVSFETIEHIPDPVRGVTELKRVLKKGGHFVGSIPIQIFHNPGTNFTYSEVMHFVRDHFPGSQLMLQTNSEIVPRTEESWQRIRFEGNKYFLFHWIKPEE